MARPWRKVRKEAIKAEKITQPGAARSRRHATELASLFEHGRFSPAYEPAYGRCPTKDGQVIAWTQRANDGVWAASVSEIPGLFTQARSLSDIPGKVVHTARSMGFSVRSEDVGVRVMHR